MAIPITSQIRNASIDLSTMDVSVVALVTDVVRDGRPVVGYGFTSNGPFAPRGLLRDRFIPGLRAADPCALLTEVGANFDPPKIWATLMTGEKPAATPEQVAERFQSYVDAGIQLFDCKILDAEDEETFPNIIRDIAPSITPKNR
jgi:hypothetical protein